MALRALARLQLNIIIEKDGGFGWFDNILSDEVYYPLFWLEEGVLGPSEVYIKLKIFYVSYSYKSFIFQVIAQNMRLLLNLPSNVQNLVAMVGLLLGLIMLIPEIAFWIKTCCAKSSSKS